MRSPKCFTLLAGLTMLPMLAAPLPGQDCPASSSHATGQVVDTTGAVVAGATITADGRPVGKTDRRGRFTTVCLAAGAHRFTASFHSFDPVTLRSEGDAPMLFRMHASDVNVTVDVSAGDDPLTSGDVAGTRTLQQADLKELADDPDEFARELQVLAAAAGGSPGQALVTVDGFQNSGSIPPKSAIAYVRINPDLFSAEYEHPPYEGGRIEIYTKPGQSKLHGALFTTQSAAFINARDPFSTSKAAIGRQRYGFELSGPIRANKADFSLNLEHRQIDNFAVVNAIVLSPAGAPVSTVYNVPTPQSLYEGSARVGLLPNKNNNLTISYTANVTLLQNLAVGGTTLQEAGFTSAQSEHDLRISNLQTISANLLHETKIGYTWLYAADTPNSTAPSLAVAGAFTGGGAPVGSTRTHRRDLEVDDDVVYSHGKHNLKAGLQLLDIAQHDTLPTNFNGQYTFGGCTAAVQACAGQTLTGFQQYQLALAGQPGGTPTTFSVTTGIPQVQVNQLRATLFVQDQYKVSSRLALAVGLRWAMQSAPETIGNVGPRLGLSYSPDRRQHLVFHLRSGLFYDTIRAARPLENRRLDGAHERQLITYSPTYNGIAAPAGTANITTLRTPFIHIGEDPSIQSHFGVEYEAPHHYHVQANLYYARSWNDIRSKNINAPFPVNGVASPTGPRPGPANTNLDQFQQSGSLKGDVIFLGLDQHSLKKLQLFVGYVRLDLRSDADDGTTFPQSSYSDVGEFARQSGTPTHQVFSFVTYHLPQKVNLSMQFNASSGMPYNVTSGFDANGDGNFNDRPAYATAADFIAARTGTQTIYPTRFGMLVPAGAGAPLGRNAGTLPWTVNLDMNLSRTFALSHAQSAEGRSLAVNLRSTNLINHTNVTAVGSVLGSPFFGVPYAAGPGRRVEAGLRYSF